MGKVGDEALVNMLTEDAKLAAGGTPAARANRRKKSRGRLHRELVLSAVCGCGNVAVVSVPVEGRSGSVRYKKKCRACAGIAAQGGLGHREPLQETVYIPKVRRSGVKVFA